MFKSKSLLARRRLFVVVAVLAVLGAVSYFSNVNTVAEVGSTTAVVGIAKTPTTNPTVAQIDAAVREAVALAGGLPDGVGHGAKIVLQPNLVEAGWYQGSGVVTNKEVVSTLVDMCEEAGASRSDITICEGAAGFHGSYFGYTTREMTLKAFVDSGMNTIPGVNLVDANNVGYRYPDYPGYSGPYNSNYVTEIVKPGFLINRKYFIPNVVAEADVLIQVPCLKNHDLAGYTGALKLSFGMAPSDIYHYPGMDIYKWAMLHQQSWGYNELETNARGMADMNYCIEPDMVVIDGLVGIQSGPTRTPLVTANPYMSCIIAGKDPVAVDTIGCLAVGYKVDSVPGIMRANTLGLGQNNPGKIEVRGLHVKDIRCWFPSWAPDSGFPGDQTPPVLGGLSISDNVHVCGYLGVSPTGMYDLNPGLCKGELYIDGELVDSQDAGGYKCSWYVSPGDTGTKALTYTIYDKMLNEASLTRTVTAHSGNPFLAAQDLPDGTTVSLGPVIFTGKTTAIDTRTFFVSSADGIHGLRVRYGTTPPSFPDGYVLGLYGTIGTVDGQRYLNCTAITPVEYGDVVAPRLFVNAAVGGADLNGSTGGVDGGLGPYNLGCLVKSAGVVSAGGSDYFYINDGSLNGGLKVKCGSISQPAAGSYVSVVGLSCSENNGGSIDPILVPRTATDILVHAQ